MKSDHGDILTTDTDERDLRQLVVICSSSLTALARA